LFFGTHVWRLACAFGFVYVVTEYGVELTICEGPSMLPTIKPRGEIILMDRFTPRWYGLQGGCNGAERARLARALQTQHEKEQQLRIQPPSQAGPETMTWHDPMIPANKLPAHGAWERLRTRLMTGISVGDVLVVQHKDRIGTVCKRVVGLPGDVVTKPSKPRQRLRRRQSGMLVVPDGHIWVEGDNPWNSSDSRSYGSVPASLIVGRVLMRVWPLRGNALMERGARPARDKSEEPQLSFSGSVVLPAGYGNQIMVRSHETVEDVAKSSTGSTS
jgi:signal peptidase I